MVHIALYTVCDERRSLLHSKFDAKNRFSYENLWDVPCCVRVWVVLSALSHGLWVLPLVLSVKTLFFEPGVLPLRVDVKQKKHVRPKPYWVASWSKPTSAGHRMLQQFYTWILYQSSRSVHDIACHLLSFFLFHPQTHANTVTFAIVIKISSAEGRCAVIIYVSNSLRFSSLNSE